MHATAVLDYLPKFKKVLGLPFAAHFINDFFIKCSLSDTPSMDKISMSYLFAFSRYQTKCVIEFLFRKLMTSWTLRFIFDRPLKQWLTGRKKGKDRNTKKWISWDEKELSRWNAKHFSVFEEMSFGEKRIDENSRHKL